MSLRRRQRRRRLVPAAALALCAHVLALLALGWEIPPLAPHALVEDHSAAIEVTLLRPRPPRREPAKVVASPRPAPSPPPAPARILVAPTPAAPPLGAPVPSPPSTSEAEANADGENLRNALRGMVGCADAAAYHLSREEHAACDQRLAAAKPAAVGPKYSAAEVAQFNPVKQDSILVRKPHNECLPHLGNRASAASPAGGAPVASRSGATTTIGLSCAWSFW